MESLMHPIIQFIMGLSIEFVFMAMIFKVRA